MRALVLISLFVAIWAAPQTPSVPTEILTAIGTFGHELSKQLHQNGKNLLVSPLSVHKALGMAVLGAEGTTKDEMLHAMALHGMDLAKLKAAYRSLGANLHHTKNAGQLRIDVANRMYLSKQHPAASAYVNEVRDALHADAVNVDFRAEGERVKNEINDFVKENTQGLIPKVLNGPLDANSLMALVNTLYFNGSWIERFAEPHEEHMFNEGCAGLAKKHDVWLRKTNTFKYVESKKLDAKLIVVPYKTGDSDAEAGLMILLPSAENSCKTDAWLNKLTWTQISAELANAKERAVELTIPKFEIESRVQLEDVLPKMGMVKAFGDADFGKMLQDKGQKVQISEVIHQTKMLVTKHGTEAAAATVLNINRMAHHVIVQNPITMNVDRSFYAAVIYQPGGQDSPAVPLFTGVVHKI